MFANCRGLLVVVVIAIVGCTSSFRSNIGLIDRLKNRGPIPLSSENPYLAPNLMLTQEMDRSGELRGFINFRGAPAAVEIEKGMFSDLRMILYYPENGEQFTLDEVSNVWVIKGPDPINQDQLDLIRDKIAGMQPSVLAGKKPIDRQAVAPVTNESLIRLQSPELRAPTPSSVPQPVSADLVLSRNQATKDLHSPESSNNSPSENNDENMAEITPRGDVVHYVTFESESMKIIAKWYTGEWSNAERLDRVNNMRPDRKLKVGDTIVIPSYLVKNKTRLTETATKALAVLMHEEKVKP